MVSDHGEVLQGPEWVEAGTRPPRKERGCFFYGCIIAVVVAILMAVAIALLMAYSYRAYSRFINQNTSPTPMPLPQVVMPEEERQDLHERFDAFQRALDRGEDTEPLVLNGDELNVLLAEKAGAKDRVYVVVEGDKLKGQVSLPLDQVGLPLVKGRYFNGKATFRVSLQDGVLVVRADSAEVNGRPVSEQFMTGLRNHNLAEDAARNPENAAVLDKLERIQVKDGKVVIEAKPKEQRSPEGPKKGKRKEGPSGDRPQEPEAPPPAG